MRSFLYVWILAITITAVFSLHENVVELTAADLHSMATVFPKLLVFYYLPWYRVFYSGVNIVKN